MLKEYCDKCKKEIDGNAGWNDEKKIRISIPSCDGDYEEVVFCKECFKKTVAEFELTPHELEKMFWIRQRQLVMEDIGCVL